MMKKASILSLLTLGMAATAAEEAFHHNLPDSGLLPSYTSISAISRMGERHGGSDLSLQSAKLTIPLSDPRKSGWNGMMLNIQLDAEATFINTGGNLELKHGEVYFVAVPVSVISPMGNGNKLTLGAAPTLASDSGAVEHGLDCLLYGMYTIKRSDTFSYTVGVAASPRFAEHVLVPIIGFEWQATPEWLIRMKGYRAEALYKVNERFSVGPFIAGEGGTWSVETEAGDRQFRVRSLVLGVTGEYNFAEPGQTKRLITFSLGSTVATSAEFTERGEGKHAYETHHYEPGLFISAGVDFRF